MNKMNIEIWSDVMCPFCYIGKRNFETALGQFANKDHIAVIWKSFQLDPTIPEVAEETYVEYLVKRKGMPANQVEELLDTVTQTAKQAGLSFHLEKSVIVNSLNAHKLLQFAQTKDLGDEMEERLFGAFFTEGKNIANLNTLTELGIAVGMDKTELQTAFKDDHYAALIKQDILEAQHVGVRGVPFFVMDRKYAVSGAQPPQVFLENLEKSFSEWQLLHPEIKLTISPGQTCQPDGTCD